MIAYSTLPACKDCLKYVYTIPEGELQRYEAESEDGETVMLPVLRDGVAPPCDSCPKGGPQNERRFVLGPRNLRALEVYERLEATHGQYRLPDRLRRCEVFAETMRVIRAAKAEGEAVLKRRLMEEAEREREFGS